MALSLLVLVFLFGHHASATDADSTCQTCDNLEAKLGQTEDKLEQMEANLKIVTRQLMMNVFNAEERARASAQSGVKRARNLYHGTKSYNSASHVGSGGGNVVLAIHDHVDHLRTVGLGEFEAVLNGVEFRTRHNDYELVQKSRESSEYGATDHIPFPPVPKDVTSKSTLEGQVKEMQEYFKAFHTSNETHRNYKPYFKPVLCYLEGAWTHSDQNSIDESFDSDRHHLAATSWLDLLEKIRYTSYTGGKENLENIAYLPTSIIDIINGTIPVLVQWNYKILCHPLKTHVGVNYFKPVIDLKTMLNKGYNLNQYSASRAVRYTLATNENGDFEDGMKDYTLLDKLMEEIPGASNYQGKMVDELFGSVTYPYDKNAKEPLNVAYYHRNYRNKEKDANGVNGRRRSFSDAPIFMAFTNQTKIAEMKTSNCNKWKKCDYYGKRVTYAVPLEIVFMTPLSEWNPYDIEFKGNYWRDPLGKTVEINADRSKRNGKNSLEKAYNGTNSRKYYMTPHEMFGNVDWNDRDPADTAANFVSVLNSKGQICSVRPTGHPIVFPNMPGVGKVRIRFPIPPIVSEGEGTWKEMDALKDIVLKPSKYQAILNDERILSL